MPWSLLLLTLIGSLLLTAAIRRYALARQMVDIPNPRSSHHTPTPRGGGIAIAGTFLIALLWAYSVGGLDRELFWAVFGAGALTAAVGWLDDQADRPAYLRLAAHFIAAAWIVVWLGALPPLSLFGLQIDFGWAAPLLTLLYLVWLLNLYNFMDGIDGIAGLEAITVCLGAALVYRLAPSGVGSSIPPLLSLAATVCGFLFWNFPKAKIFMGDTGSGFLGAVLGAFSLHAAWLAPELFWAWLILLGCFITDATITLLRRLWRREKFYTAHRSHAYQHAAARFAAHWPVSLAIAAINIAWLLPIAALVALGKLDGATGVLIAYLPLIWLALRFTAGQK